MSSIEVGVDIHASPEEVWEVVRRVGDHVDWMVDATAIRFRTEQREGEGTTFECDTAFGPLKLTDVMEITEWRDGEAMGVRHCGLVTGTGRFTLEPAGRHGTGFTWAEELTFPAKMGGALGAKAAKPVMTLVWRRNLGRLKQIVERRAG